MNTQEILASVKDMSVEDRLTLVEAIWDSIAEQNGCVELTDAQMQELDRRYDDYLANPNAGSTWEEVKARILNKS